jgi:hypothetical protein
LARRRLFGWKVRLDTGALRLGVRRTVGVGGAGHHRTPTLTRAQACDSGRISPPSYGTGRRSLRSNHARRRPRTTPPVPETDAAIRLPRRQTVPTGREHVDNGLTSPRSPLLRSGALVFPTETPMAPGWRRPHDWGPPPAAAVRSCPHPVDGLWT